MKCPKCKSNNVEDIGGFWSTEARCKDCGHTDLDAVFNGTGKRIMEVSSEDE